METKDVFATVCYLVLMDHHGASFIEAHPSYIAEKSTMLRAGWDAFAALDSINKKHIMMWCNRWQFDVPESITANMKREELAAAALRRRGFKI